MKLISTVAAIALLAAPAVADGFGGGITGSKVIGGFGGSVSAHSSSGGLSATGSFGGHGNTSIRNQSGARQFSGAAAEWGVDNGSTSLIVDTITQGFDFSSTRSRGGFGGALAARTGNANAGGGFGGTFGGGFICFGGCD